MEHETDGELVWKGGFTSPHSLEPPRKAWGVCYIILLSLANHPIPLFPWLSTDSTPTCALYFSSRAAEM